MVLGGGGPVIVGIAPTGPLVPSSTGQRSIAPCGWGYGCLAKEKKKKVGFKGLKKWVFGCNPTEGASLAFI